MPGRALPKHARRRHHLARGSAAALLLSSGVISFSVVTAVPASASPPSLTSEFLASGATSENGGALVTSATCSPTSPSTIAFTATGTATGPYAGTFSESGVITVSTAFAGQYVNGVPFNVVSSLEAYFTIESPTGTVTGSKRLASSGVIGLCQTYSEQLLGNTGRTVTGFFREVSPDSTGWGATYDALVVAADGTTYRDTGRAGLLLVDLSVTPTTGITQANSFNAAFFSDGITPVSVVGAATGGGQVGSSGGTAFGFTARSSSSGIKGQCEVVDQAAAVTVHCTDVTAFYLLTPTTVRLLGHATVNGQATTYRMDVADVADPGAGTDTFDIVTGTGYSAGGTLARGNVQVHRS